MTTYLLIHGAYQGGWIWADVAAGLADRGHRVLHPSLDGCAERQGGLRPGITTESHAEELAQLLFFEDLTEVTAVATSSGGMVLCRLAELATDRLAELVFVDALALDDGERIGDIVDRSPTAPPVGSAEPLLASGPSAEHLEQRLLADLDPGRKRWAVPRFTVHPIAVLEEPVRLERFWTMDWDADVVYCRQSVNPPEAHQQRTAERLSARWHELDTGHYPMLSAPEELTELLLR